MPSILHIIQRYYPYTGGSEQVAQVLAERQAADGHHVQVWTTNAWDLDHFWARNRRTIDQAHEMHNGVAIRRFPVVRLPTPAITYPIIRRLMVEIGRLPRTAPILRRMAMITPRVPSLLTALRSSPQPDLIHTANITLDFTILPALKYAQQHTIPFIITPYVHLGEPHDRSLVRYYTMPHHIEIMRQSDRVIVMTGLEEAALADLGVPRSIMRRVGVGVEPAELMGGDAARFKAETGINQPFVLFVGTFAKEKGTLDVISAMQQLWAQGRSEELVLIGSPMAQFEQAFAALPAEIKAKIHVFARASQERKRDALAAATLLAMPSRTDSFGIVYLEAWLYKLPVIGANAGGVPDVIRHGETGLLVNYGDVNDLTNALRRLLDDPALREQFGTAGYDYTLRELTWDRKYAQMMDVYTELGVSGTL